MVVWFICGAPSLVKIGRDPGSKMIDPSSHGFIGDCDSAFRQQILDVAEAQSESGIQPDRLLNDHGRKAVTGVADFGHHEGNEGLSARGQARQAPNVTMPKRLFPLDSVTNFWEIQSCDRENFRCFVTK
jgi:hypothetical protein